MSCEPGITFQRTENETLDAWADLDSMPGGVRLHVQEQWGQDKYLVTISRTGLQITMEASLFHLSALQQALKEYVDRLRAARGWPVLGPAGIEPRISTTDGLG